MRCSMVIIKSDTGLMLEGRARALCFRLCASFSEMCFVLVVIASVAHASPSVCGRGRRVSVRFSFYDPTLVATGVDAVFIVKDRL